MSERYVKIWLAKDDKKTVGLVFSRSYLKGKSTSDVAKSWPKLSLTPLGKVHSSPWFKSWVGCWMYDDDKKFELDGRR